MSILDNVIDAKAYVGTLKRYSNPKTEKYWLNVQNWVVVINPETVVAQLEAAKTRIAELKKEWKQILVICEKSFYREEIEQLGTEAGVHYLNYKIPGWVLTNFDTLLSRIRSMNELKKHIESEDFQRLTKKEKLVKIRQYQKLEVVYKWVKNLKNKPDFVIIIDWKFMSKFVDEVEKTKIDNLVLATTNFDRRWKDENIVMMNMSSYGAMDFAVKYILK